MEYIKLGKSDLELSRITFGAWAIGGWMWGGADENDAIKAIHLSLDLGINTFDTAPVYGMGQSELLVGKALKGQREKVKILTKYGLGWNLSNGSFFFDSTDNNGNPVTIYRLATKERVIEECEQSLRRLQTDHIDLYQIHWPDPSTPIDETMEAVLKLKEQGKIIEAGVCNYDAEQMAVAEKTIKLASNQVPYSMIKRDIEKDVVPYCLNNNCGILAYSPLQRGLLTGKFSTNSSFNKGDTREGNPYYKPKNIQKTNEFLDSLAPIREKYGVSNSQLVINWTLQQPGISVALVGARNEKQTRDNAGALKFTLQKEDIDAINKQLNKLTNNLSL